MTAAAVQIHELRDRSSGEKTLTYKCGITLSAGKITALIGDDRLKSRVARAAAGIDPNFSAIITLEKEAFAVRDAGHARQLKIAALIGTPLIFPSMTALENLRVYLLRNTPRIKIRAQELWQELFGDTSTHADFPCKIIAKNLTAADQRRIEIVRALLLEPKLLIFDNALTAFSDAQQMKIFAALRTRKEMSVLTTFRAPSLLRFADEFHFANYESGVGERQVPSPKIIAELQDRFYPVISRPELKVGKTALEILGLKIFAKSPDISFALRRGEILGVVGLTGDGIENFIEVLSGKIRAAKGVLTVNGTHRRFNKLSARALKKLGVAAIDGGREIPDAEIYLFADFNANQNDPRPAEARQAMYESIAELTQKNRTVIFATYNFDRILRIAHTAATFHAGAMCPPRAVNKWTRDELALSAANGTSAMASLL